MAGFTYTVDARGNRTAATEVLHTATGTTERALTYTYDALSRLVAADASFGADYAYGYDVAGNLVDMNGVARVYNTADQLIFDGTNALAYDAAGNLLGDGANAYTWDTAGRLVGIGAGDDPAYTFSYNGDGDRVAQTAGEATTTYTLDTTPALTLVVGEATGPQRTAFIHDARGIHAQVGEALTYAVSDGLGSVRAWTSAAPPDAYITYDPYGAPDTDITGFAFTGEPRDATGLQYHRARYYDPALGAWASLDQLETPNRYAYVDGNVVNWTDPSGYCPESPWWNDIPGHRCIWLANELHRIYSVPLSVAMQKDVLELEAIYALGNLKSTFNDSSWSQTMRDNPGAAIVVAGGAAAGTAAIVVTGGAATPFVAGAAGAAAAGGISGAAVGTAYAAGMYELAIAGHCGCSTQEQVIAIGQESFLARARETAALYGSVYGGLAGAGPVGQIMAGAGGVVDGGYAVVQAGQDVAGNGLNICNAINGVLGATGAVTGGAVTYRAVSNIRIRMSPELTVIEVGTAADLDVASPFLENLEPSPATSAVVDQQRLQAILAKYPPTSGQCESCARQIHSLLGEAGMDAQIVRIETSTRYLATVDNVVLSVRSGPTSPAYHEFVRVRDIVRGDMVYDSLTGPDGMAWSDYRALFGDDWEWSEFLSLGMVEP
jgi:RHS repeat-associated protein